MNVRALAATLAVAGACLFLAGPAHAFFPFGGFTEVNQQLRFMTWPLSYLDTDGDGNVGPGEGVRWTFEGEREWEAFDEEGNRITFTTGWSREEQEILKRGFQVWQNIPTSYISFYFTNPVTEPLFTRPITSPDFVIGEEITGIDLINYIKVEDPGEETLPPGVLAVTLITVVLEDTIVEVPGLNYAFPVTGGQIIECDMVYNGAAHRERVVEIDAGDGTTTTQVLPATFDLLATHVHEVGHSIGLGHTPLNNLSEILDDSANTGLIAELEQPVFAQRNAAGQLERVGATPTMYPLYFATDLGDGKFKAGMADLAPDDIAGASFLYPRGSQARYFTVKEEVRSQTRLNFPSSPLPGAHVVAWSNVDNNIGTRRVPLFSTMAGLYENQALFGGKFEMINLLKQHETMAGVTFDATYVFTSNPLDGLSRPFGYTPEDFDSTRVLFGPNTFDFFTAFPSEVFREDGNLLGIEQREQGTPLTYDSVRGKVVSVNSGKTLSTMLPGTKPMFGARNDVCWLNVVVAGVAPTGQTPQFLRDVRDRMLLGSAVGTAVMDAYYRTAPPVARYLSTHPRAFEFARGAFGLWEWVYAHAEVLLMVSGALFALGVAAKLRRWRMLRNAAGGVLVASLLLAGGQAHALLAYMSDEQMVKTSDNVLVGSVESVESYYISEGVIVTDITIVTEDNVKGHLNKGGRVILRQPGGRVGPIVRHVTSLPQFREGEEVVLFLQMQKRTGPVVVGGARGKLMIRTDALTGEKYVASGLALGGPADVEKDAGGKQAQQRITLDAFTEYLREIDRTQKAAEEFSDADG